MFSRKAKLPEEELRELYMNQGLSMTEIGERFGVGASSVRRRLSELGVVSRSRGPKGSRILSHHEMTEHDLRELYLEQKLSIPQIAELSGWGRETVRLKMIEYGIPIRSFSQATLVQHDTGAEYHDFSGDLLEKAYLIGFRLGDLSVVHQRKASEVIRISCSSTRMEQIELIQKLFERYGHVNVNRKLRIAFNGMIEHSIACSVNKSFEFLLTYVSDIPSWILNQEDVFLSFFGGLSDAEGSFHLKSNKGTKTGRYSIKHTDLRLLEQCHTRLISLGVLPSSLTKVYDAGRQTSKRGIFATRALWGFAVDNKESLLYLIDLVSPYILHSKRHADMELVRENVEWRNTREFLDEATQKRLATTKRTKEAKKKNQH